MLVGQEHRGLFETAATPPGLLMIEVALRLLSDTMDEDVRALVVAPVEHPGGHPSSLVCDANVSTRPKTQWSW
jgi:hypothetical protein